MARCWSIPGEQLQNDSEVLLLLKESGNSWHGKKSHFRGGEQLSLVAQGALG